MPADGPSRDRWTLRPDDWRPLLDLADADRDDTPRFERTTRPTALLYVFAPRGHRQARLHRFTHTETAAPASGTSRDAA